MSWERCLISLDTDYSDFNHPKGGILGLMVTMQVIGGIACLPFAPFAADIFGRRHPVAFGSVLTVFGAALQGGATNLGMFIAGRFFIGVGGSFAAVSAAPLIAELSYPTHRAIFTAVYNTSWVCWQSLMQDRTNKSTSTLVLSSLPG